MKNSKLRLNTPKMRIRGDSKERKILQEQHQQQPQQRISVPGSKADNSCIYDDLFSPLVVPRRRIQRYWEYETPKILDKIRESDKKRKKEDELQDSSVLMIHHASKNLFHQQQPFCPTSGNNSKENFGDAAGRGKQEQEEQQRIKLHPKPADQQHLKSTLMQNPKSNSLVYPALQRRTASYPPMQQKQHTNPTGALFQPPTLHPFPAPPVKPYEKGTTVVYYSETQSRWIFGTVEGYSHSQRIYQMQICLGLEICDAKM